MFSFIIFVLSGIIITLLIVAKTWELKKHKSIWYLRLISQADDHIRNFSHDMTHNYPVYKEKMAIFFKKQLPLHTKNIYYKSEAVVKEKLNQYFGSIRNIKLLNSKNKEGISEFFRNMKDLEEETAEALKDMDEAEERIRLEGEEKKG